MKKYRNHIIIGAVIVAVLAFAFWWGGDAPGLRGWAPQTASTEQTGQAEAAVASAAPSIEPETEATAEPQEAWQPDEPAEVQSRPEGESGAPLAADEKVAMAAQMAGASSAPASEGSESYSERQGMEIDASTGKDQFQTEPVPEGQSVPAEPQDAVVTDQEMTCTLSVRCDAILQNMDWLDPEKVELVPGDGVIFPEQTVTFYEGESVFNLLLREMKKNKIHLEYTNTPIYNSAYIEGINNLYEYDCGELSGWMYKVNGWFPNYGCSRYTLKPGDRVEWVYTCVLGVDVGGYYASAGEWQR